MLKWKDEQAQRRELQPNDYTDSDYICTMFDGQLMRPDYVTKHFKKVLTKNGLPVVRFHDLRHSSAKYLKYLGFDPKDIQTWLRHADIQTTLNMYIKMDMEDKTNIADMLNARIANFSI